MTSTEDGKTHLNFYILLFSMLNDSLGRLTKSVNLFFFVICMVTVDAKIYSCMDATIKMLLKKQEYFRLCFQKCALFSPLSIQNLECKNQKNQLHVSVFTKNWRFQIFLRWKVLSVEVKPVSMRDSISALKIWSKWEETYVGTFLPTVIFKCHKLRKV